MCTERPPLREHQGATRGDGRRNTPPTEHAPIACQEPNMAKPACAEKHTQLKHAFNGLTRKASCRRYFTLADSSRSYYR